MTEPIDGSKEAMNLREDPSYPLEDSSIPSASSSFPSASSSFPPAKTKETPAHTISLPYLPPSPSAPSRGKSNKFERFFGDSTLTSLTFGNTFRFPILPSRRAVFLCLPQILIRGRQRKTKRRIGKIGRRKVFSKVKNVNVESPKNDSKLLDFSERKPTPTPP